MDEKKGISKAAAGIIAVLAFAAGLFVGVVVSNETRQELVSPSPVAGPSVPAGPQVPADMADHIAHLEAEAAKQPSDADTWIKLGNAYFDTSQAEKAIRAYERALEIAPGNADVLTDLGVMYRAAGQPAKAVEQFDKAIAANPAHQIARLNKGVVLLHDLKQREKAVQTWEDLLALNPGAVAPGGKPVAELVRELKAGAPGN
ncbi:tetratricopeptide repeat protein [Desulfocurvibacter africanus]|uniref:tetratricopeptide repeat protein n=1 Tax=Desulfocurvibacter africanus TaxID=873 RepID=UPI002FDAE5A7